MVKTGEDYGFDCEGWSVEGMGGLVHEFRVMFSVYDCDFRT